MLFDINIDDNPVRCAALLSCNADGLEEAKIAQSSFSAIDHDTVVCITLRDIEFSPDNILRGSIIAAVILGLVETAVATLVDPGLTLVAAYAIFLLVLLFRPQGLFGRRPA